MDDAPEVPGYLITRPLGRGSGGPVWAATRCQDGAAVAIKVLPAAAATMSIELAALRGLRHPHVVALLADVPLADGTLALVLELVRGGSLARVVRARGHLTPGETVTVLTTLGTTLAELHRLGVSHGDLSPGNVLFHPDGRPAVADLGLAQVGAMSGRSDDQRPEQCESQWKSQWKSQKESQWESESESELGAWGTAGFVDPHVLLGAEPGAAADSYGLGALGWFALVGAPPGHPALRPSLGDVCPTAPAALVAAIEAALDPDPTRRIGPAELARAAYDACPPEPVGLVSGDDPVDELTHRIRAWAADEAPAPVRRRSRSGPMFRRLGGPALALALALAVGIGVSTGVLVAVRGQRSGPGAGPRPLPTARPGATRSAAIDPDGEPVDWPRVMSDLAQARAAAFADPVRGVAGFDVVGSGSARLDGSALASLRRQGLRYSGLRLQVRPVAVVRPSRGAARVTVMVTPSAYDVLDQTGARRRHVPPGPAAMVTIELTATSAGWRVSTVR